MKTLASLLLLLLTVVLLQRPAHAQFVIVSPSNPEVSGTVAVKLGTIPPTVWWTCIKLIRRLAVRRAVTTQLRGTRPRSSMAITILTLMALAKVERFRLTY
jgi:hypothetical protein